MFKIISRLMLSAKRHFPFFRRDDLRSPKPMLFNVVKFVDYLLDRDEEIRSLIFVGATSFKEFDHSDDVYARTAVFVLDSMDSLDTIVDSRVRKIPLKNSSHLFELDVISNAVVICKLPDSIGEPSKTLSILRDMYSECHLMIILSPYFEKTVGELKVKDWSVDLFGSFLKESKLEFFQLGRLVNSLDRSLLLFMGGNLMSWSYPLPDIKIAAIINTFNEVDIIKEVVLFLREQGIDVYVFDNWSTDGTFEELEKFNGQGVFVKRFPEEPTDQYEWAMQLRNTTDFAKKLDHDWIIHYDADELRYGPWPELNLADSIRVVEQKGYNAIDFTVLDFRFIENQSYPHKKFEDDLTYFEFGCRPGHFYQVKCWKNIRNVNYDLASSGGHNICFSGRKVFPLKFLTKHYPLRSVAQAQEKVLKNRKPRFQKENAALGWHNQYAQYNQVDDFKFDKKHLIQWDSQNFYSDFLIERLSGIGILNGRDGK